MNKNKIAGLVLAGAIISGASTGATSSLINNAPNKVKTSTKNEKLLSSRALIEMDSIATVINGNNSLVLKNSPNGSIISYLSSGEMLHIIAKQGNYYKVTVQETGGVGFISSKNVEIIVNSSNSEFKSLSGNGHIVNVSSEVHLRGKATLNSNIIGFLKNGDSFQILGKEGQWYKIDSNGNIGFIFEEYVAKDTTSVINKSDNAKIDVINSTVANSKVASSINASNNTKVISMPKKELINKDKVNSHNSVVGMSDTTISNLDNSSSSSKYLNNINTKHTTIKNSNNHNEDNSHKDNIYNTLDGQTGGVLITFLNSDTSIPVTNKAVTIDNKNFMTNSKGEVNLIKLKPGQSTLNIKAENYNGTVLTMDIMPDKTVTASVMLTPDNGTALLTFVNANHSRPVANINVNLNGNSYTTDSNGQVLLKNLNPGNHEISVAAKGFNNNTVKVNVNKAGQSTNNVLLTPKVNFMSFAAENKNVSSNLNLVGFYNHDIINNKSNKDKSHAVNVLTQYNENKTNKELLDNREINDNQNNLNSKTELSNQVKQVNNSAKINISADTSTNDNAKTNIENKTNSSAINKEKNIKVNLNITKKSNNIDTNSKHEVSEHRNNSKLVNKTNAKSNTNNSKILSTNREIHSSETNISGNTSINNKRSTSISNIDNSRSTNINKGTHNLQPSNNGNNTSEKNKKNTNIVDNKSNVDNSKVISINKENHNLEVNNNVENMNNISVKDKKSTNIVNNKLNTGNSKVISINSGTHNSETNSNVGIMNNTNVKNKKSTNIVNDKSSVGNSKIININDEHHTPKVSNSTDKSNFNAGNKDNSNTINANKKIHNSQVNGTSKSNISSNTGTKQDNNIANTNENKTTINNSLEGNKINNESNKTTSTSHLKNINVPSGNTDQNNDSHVKKTTNSNNSTHVANTNTTNSKNNKISKNTENSGVSKSSNNTTPNNSSNSVKTTNVNNTKTSSTNQSKAALQEAIVKYAEQFLGCPYVWGATGPNSFDCSGLTSYVYRHFGYNIGRTTYQQIDAGTPVSLNDLEPGDLLFFGNPSAPDHVVMYIGDHKYIQAPHPGEDVDISSWNWGGIVAARRIV